MASRPAQARPAGLRQHVAGAVAHVREQASAAYYRAVDPTPLVGRAARRGRGRGRRLSCRRRRCDVLRAAEHRPDHRLHRARRHGAPRAQAQATYQARACRPGADNAGRDTDRHRRTPDTDADADVDGRRTTAQAPATTATTSAPPPAPEDQFEPTSAGHHQSAGCADKHVEAQAAGAGARRWPGGVRRTMTRRPERRQSMHRPTAVRVIAAAGALSVLLAALAATLRVGGSVHGRELPGRPAELQHHGLRGLRDPGNEDRSRVQPRGARAARPDHRERGPGGQRAARRGVDRDDQRAGGHDVDDAALGGDGSATRLPLRAAALRRCSRRRADPDQEHPRQPALLAPGPARRRRATGRERSTCAARRASCSA